VASHQGTHTYRLSKFLKSFKLHRAVAFASSAAERQDYEELLTSRQAFQRIPEIFLSNSRNLTIN
ncbi:MAG: hypothetical protein ABIK25_08055, partial [Pseudomonadota bacterium]